MTYVILSVASDAEATRLVEDIREHPGEDLMSPHWSNRIRAEVVASLAVLPAALGGAA